MQKSKDSNIIAPIARHLIKAELTSKRFVRHTNKLGNEIYVVDYQSAPNVVKEIGRLRELSFRDVGGGTGSPYDLDEFDSNKACFQLIVYNPEEEEIIGGYRFIRCREVYDKEKNIYLLPTSNYFEFSKEMKENFLPYSIELGRSFIQPKYQLAQDLRKGVFSLMNIWDGLGTLVIKYPNIKYFFGKVTMYSSYDKRARNIMLSFLYHFFPDRLRLARPKEKHHVSFDKSEFSKFFNSDISYKEGFRLLNKLLKERGEIIPSLVNIYMNLSSTMFTLGTIYNPDFGDVEETGLIITIEDIHQEIRNRHINY